VAQTRRDAAHNGCTTNSFMQPTNVSGLKLLLDHHLFSWCQLEQCRRREVAIELDRP
jgi:hypothetical protein